MGPVVVRLDMVKVGRGLERIIIPIQFLHPRVDGRIIVSNGANVAFEMAHVNRVETYDGDPEPHICFCERVSNEIVLTRQNFFDLVKRFEDLKDSLFVSFLSGRKSCSVNAVVDVGINPVVEFINFSAMTGGVKIQSRLLGRDDIVKGAVEDPNNFGALIVDDGLRFLIPKHGNSEPATVIRIGLKIKIFDMFGFVQGIDVSTWELIYRCERPPLCSHSGRDHRNRNDVFKAFQLPENQGPRRPRAGIGYVEVIAPSFRFELTTFLDSAAKS